MSTSSNRWRAPSLDDVAGNGVMNRRALLGHGFAFAGAMGAGAAGTATGTAAEPVSLLLHGIAHEHERAYLLARISL
jgi:hypothetical protein